MMIELSSSADALNGSVVMPSNNMYYDVFVKSVDLEEALEDSPMLRKKIKNAENTVDDFATGIKKLVKSLKHYQQSARDHQQSFTEFVSEVVTLKTTMGVSDDTLDKGFLKLVNGLKDIANFQDLLTQQMDTLITPLQDFINTDAKTVKEHTKKYERTTSHLDSAVSKLGQVKKKSQKVEEYESEVVAARRAHTSASLDVALVLNETLAKKRFEFLERIEVYMHAQMHYFHQGFECFKDLEPSMNSYAKNLQATREYFEKETKRARERRTDLEANPVGARSPPHHAQSVKRGYLFKRSAEDVINTWSKRYFVLQDNQLFAYKNGKDQQPDFSLQLLLYTVKSREDLDRRNCFELVAPPDKSVLLQAESEEIKQEWIQAIQNCISNLLNAQPSHEEKHTRKATSLLDGATDSDSLARLKLKQLNPICADCDSKDPEWASINLGVLLCIDCSGIHRSMGVHISKVRSLTLDAWDTDLIEVASKLGNKKVNEVFEAQVPGDRVKPTSTSSWEVRQRWIRDKYEGKKFVKPSYSFPVEMQTLLAEAISKDDACQIVKLYAQGADLNYQYPSNSKRTPLHLAVAANHPALVLLLLLNAADPAVRDEQGWTPLHLAADLALANCAIPLLQKNCAHVLSITDKQNRTPLDIAVGNGGADCVTLFRLAQLAREESGNVSYEESFAQALRMFTKDARTKS